MPPPSDSMRARVCLITGATSGIGEVAARELAGRGATVVIAGRDPGRCRDVADAVRRDTGNDSVDAVCGDLSSRDGVRGVAAQFLERHDRLHVLVNNAGALFAHRRQSADGIEMTLALNHLAGFLLTHLLLDTLKRSAPARIINVSSGAHDDVPAFDFNDPQAVPGGSRRPAYGDSEFLSFLFALGAPWKHPGFTQYAHTKLANLLFTFELSRRLHGTGITANALHPGFVRTNFVRGNGTLGAFLRFWAALLGISPERGARTLVWLATSPEFDTSSGGYYVKQRLAEPSAAARDPDAATRMWSLSEVLTGIGR